MNADLLNLATHVIEHEAPSPCVTHYRGIVAALARTIELQTAIGEAIGEWPLQ